MIAKPDHIKATPIINYLFRKQLLRLLFAFIFSLLCHNILAANNNFSVGARSWGMANSTVAITDEWSIHHNQAAMVGFTKLNASAYFENKYLLPQLGIKAVCVNIPSKIGVFGLNANYYGYNNYNEQKLGLAYAKKLGEKLNIGVQFDYLRTFINEYGSKSVVTFEAGILSRVSSRLALGAHVYNPVRMQLSDVYDERIPTIMKLGLSYHFSQKVFVTAETEKDIIDKPVFKTGVEYHPIDILYLRIGVSSNPTLGTFGFGLALKGWKLDIATSYHQVLGITPHISISYEIK